jgi:hypothetical protein
MPVFLQFTTAAHNILAPNLNNYHGIPAPIISAVNQRGIHIGLLNQEKSNIKTNRVGA